MLIIRLLRTGKKNQPSYKVVATDRRNPPRGGTFVEEVGFFNPKTREKKFNAERINYWISVGAQTSDTIHNMLVDEKIINEPKRKIIFTKKAPEPVAEEPKPAAAPKPAEEPAPEAVPAETPAETAEPAEAPAVEEAPAETPAEEPKPAE
jgi:small subunit ribosomal protein S16